MDCGDVSDSAPATVAPDGRGRNAIPRLRPGRRPPGVRPSGRRVPPQLRHLAGHEVAPAAVGKRPGLRGPSPDPPLCRPARAPAAPGDRATAPGAASRPRPLSGPPALIAGRQAGARSRPRADRLRPHFGGALPVQCIVNEYRPGQGIGMHADHSDFGPVVASLSLAADWPMRFRPRSVRPYARDGLPGDERSSCSPAARSWSSRAARDRRSCTASTAPTPPARPRRASPPPSAPSSGSARPAYRRPGLSPPLRSGRSFAGFARRRRPAGIGRPAGSRRRSLVAHNLHRPGSSPGAPWTEKSIVS